MTIILFDLSEQFCSLSDVNKAHVPQSRNKMSSLITFGTVVLCLIDNVVYLICKAICHYIHIFEVGTYIGILIVKLRQG